MTKLGKIESLMTGPRQLKEVRFAERQMLQYLGRRVADLRPGTVTDNGDRFLTVNRDTEQGRFGFTMWSTPRMLGAESDVSVETELAVQITGESPFAPPPIIAMVRNVHTDYDYEPAGSYSAIRSRQMNDFGIFTVYRAVTEAEKLQHGQTVQPLQSAPAAPRLRFM